MGRGKSGESNESSVMFRITIDDVYEENLTRCSKIIITDG